MIRCLLLTTLFCIPFGFASGQILPDEVGPDSLDYAFVPVITYSSDVGFVGGAVFSYYDYRGNIQPFNRYIEASAIASTKGYVQINGLYEQTRSFGTDIRSRLKIDFDRLAKDNYFGIGNSTTFDEDQWEDDYYFFKSVGTGFNYRLRKPVYEDEEVHLDLVAGVGLEYQIPYVLQEHSSFNEFTPNGSRGGTIGFITAGAIWENRDSEFDPGSGNRAAFELIIAPSLISKYPLSIYRLDLRQYVRFFNAITLAARIEGRHSTGDVPYWRMPTLGDDYTLRGYPLNRFKGKSSISYNLELRTWIFHFSKYKIKLGGQLFTDMGRVFSEGNDWNDFFNNYRHTYGIGGAISLFNPDFILRGDIGFSEDVSRIYIGVGYTF